MTQPRERPDAHKRAKTEKAAPLIATHGSGTTSLQDSRPAGGLRRSARASPPPRARAHRQSPIADAREPRRLTLQLAEALSDERSPRGDPRTPPGPTPGSPELPSVGSAGHADRTCKPCAFAHAGRCANGPRPAHCQRRLCPVRGQQLRRQFGRSRGPTRPTLVPMSALSSPKSARLRPHIVQYGGRFRPPTPLWRKLGPTARPASVEKSPRS